MESPESALYITGLPIGSDEDKVKEIMGKYGTVKSIKVLPAQADKNDVACIVNMESAEQAAWLIENVSGKVPEGLTEPLVIKKKNSNNWSKGGGKGGYMSQWQMQMMYYKGWGGKGGGKGWGGSSFGGLSSFPAEKKVWIGGVPEALDYKELQAHFPGCKFATVMKGKGAGTGGVAFATPEEATAAIATLNGSELAGATIEVDVWTKKEKEPEPAPVEAEAA